LTPKIQLFKIELNLTGIITIIFVLVTLQTTKVLPYIV